jgi:hypothetical protein
LDCTVRSGAVAASACTSAQGAILGTRRPRGNWLKDQLGAAQPRETTRSNEAVKRNLVKFPADFMFALTQEE